MQKVSDKKIIHLRSVLIFLVAFLVLIIGILVYILIARPWSPNENTEDKVCSNTYSGFCATKFGLQCVPKNLFSEQLASPNASFLIGTRTVYDYVSNASGGTATWAEPQTPGVLQPSFSVPKNSMNLIQIFEALRVWRDSQSRQSQTIAVVFLLGTQYTCILMFLDKVVVSYENVETVPADTDYVIAVEDSSIMKQQLKYDKEYQCPGTPSLPSDRRFVLGDMVDKLKLQAKQVE
jgi:hypothetical protein